MNKAAARQQIQRLRDGISSDLEALEALEDAIGLEVEDRPTVIGRDEAEQFLPPFTFDERGWAGPTPLGGWLHQEVADAIEWLAEESKSDPFALEALDEVRFYFVFHGDDAPEFVPADPVIAKCARDAANSGRGVAFLHRPYNHDFPGGADVIREAGMDLNLWGPGRHRVQHFHSWKETPEEIATRTARAIRSAPERRAEIARQAAEDEANGVQRPTPGPRPNP